MRCKLIVEVTDHDIHKSLPFSRRGAGWWLYRTCTPGSRNLGGHFRILCTMPPYLSTSMLHVRKEDVGVSNTNSSWNHLITSHGESLVMRAWRSRESLCSGMIPLPSWPSYVHCVARETRVKMQKWVMASALKFSPSFISAPCSGLKQHSGNLEVFLETGGTDAFNALLCIPKCCR